MRDASAPMYCTHCGAKQATGIANPAAYRTLPERYDLVAKQPSFRTAFALRPRLPVLSHLIGTLGLAIGLVLIAALIGQVLYELIEPLLWVGRAIFALGVALALYEIWIGIRRVRAPTEAVIAVIQHEDTKATGGGAGADHRVFLRLRDGAERQVSASGVLAGTIAPGDIGLAYVQFDRLLDFRWFDVMPMPLAPGEPPRAPSCSACAAPLTFESKRHCTYCNAPLAEPDLGEFGRTFAAVFATPAAQASLARKPRGGLPGLVKPLFILMCAVYLDLLFAWLAMGDKHRGLAIGFLVFLGGGVTLWGAILLGLRAGPRFQPRKRAIAMTVRHRDVVVDKQQGTYKHHVTIAVGNGARREFRVMPEVAPKVARPPGAPPRFGVAHVRGDWLVAFDEIAT